MKPKHFWRRPGRWLRRTGWLLEQMRADFGLTVPGGPIWLRDNPFLLKQGRTETRRSGLSLRLAAAVAVLGTLLVGGLLLQRRYGDQAAGLVSFVFHTSLPVVYFVLLSFVHVLLITSTRTAAAVSLANEARRATLPDLLMTPLRRAEMLLAMGVGPARSAFLLALAGLPVYALLGQFGGLTGWEIVCLYILFLLLCYQPPVSAVPPLPGQAPDAPPGQFLAAPSRRAVRRASYLGIGFPLVLGTLFFGQFLGAIGGGWLTHLFSALNLPLSSVFSFLIFFSWPYYVVQLFSERLPFFGVSLLPLWYVLPLMVMQWAGSALASAAALSAGTLAEMRLLPLWTRAQTLSRWTARAAGLCALAVVWRAWVESGDTAGLARLYAAGPGWDAAGLLLLLGGFSLPNVCGRALAVNPQGKEEAGKEGTFRAPALVLRRALKRSLRPLGVAAAGFLAACVLGHLSPFAAPVYATAAKIGLIGISTAVWAAGVRRALPKIGAWAKIGLLYVIPFAALSVPGLRLASALSPAAAWVRLFAGGPGLVSRFPVWPLGPLPPLWVCAAAPALAGLALMATAQRGPRQVPAEAVQAASAKRLPVRNEAQTAALMAWVVRRTDNPLLIYEMRVRTRSGQWFVQAVSVPLVFLAAVAAALVYPQVVESFAFLSPFHFFAARGNSAPLLVLASLLLLMQCYTLGLRGQVIGESLILKDRQQGTWGFLLLTPLTIPQIFWGKLFGQAAAVLAAWAGAGLCCLILYFACVPQVGLGPALAAWASGQMLVAALLTLGMGLGTALATFPVVQKTLKGLSTLLLVLIVGGIVYADFQYGPDEWNLAAQMFFGSVFALALSVPLFWFAVRRMARQRERDVAAGDGAE